MPAGLFHGWKIVGLSLLTQALQAGILIYAFGTMALAIEQEFGASRAEVMISATVLSLASNLVSPFLGSLVDRRSVRQLMLLAVAALALGLAALGQTRSLWQVWLVFGTLLPLANVLLGQLTTSALITRWFVRLRGRAMGIAAVGTSLGGFTVPVLLTWLIGQYGWRAALGIIGIGAFLITAPLIRWLVVDRPAELGVQPDGAAERPEPTATPVAAGNGIGSILRDRAFWCETAAIGVALFVYLGFLSNLYPHAVALGTSPARAASLMSIVAVCSIAGKLGFGTVADRIDLRLTMLSSFVLMIGGSYMLGSLETWGGLTGGAVLFGLAAGGLLPVWGAMVARSFGQARFGRALGAMNLAMAPITLLSAPYAGYLFDRYGSYEVAFLSYCGILAVAALALAPLRFPDPVNSEVRP
jgi:MFS family permease